MRSKIIKQKLQAESQQPLKIGVEKDLSLAFEMTDAASYCHSERKVRNLSPAIFILRSERKLRNHYVVNLCRRLIRGDGVL